MSRSLRELQTLPEVKRKSRVLTVYEVVKTHSNTTILGYVELIHLSHECF